MRNLCITILLFCFCYLYSQNDRSNGWEKKNYKVEFNDSVQILDGNIKIGENGIVLDSVVNSNDTTYFYSGSTVIMKGITNPGSGSGSSITKENINDSIAALDTVHIDTARINIYSDGQGNDYTLSELASGENITVNRIQLVGDTIPYNRVEGTLIIDTITEDRIIRPDSSNAVNGGGFIANLITTNGSSVYFQGFVRPSSVTTTWSTSGYNYYRGYYDGLQYILTKQAYTAVNESPPEPVTWTIIDTTSFYTYATSIDASVRSSFNEFADSINYYATVDSAYWDTTTFYQMIPHLGTTYAQQRINCIRTDVDTFPNLLRQGSGGTYDANGFDGNDSEYFLTQIDADSLELNNTAVTFYANSNFGNSDCVCGAEDGTSSTFRMLLTTTPQIFCTWYNSTDGAMYPNTPTQIGCYTAQRNSNTYMEVVRNKSVLGTNTSGGGTLPAYEIAYCANNSGGSMGNISTTRMCFYALHKTLSPRARNKLHDLVIKLQTDLGRE